MGRRHHDPRARHRRRPTLYREAIAPHLTPGKTLMFAHGFNIRFGTIAPPPDVDVSMIAPKAPGPPRARGLRGGRRHAGAPRRAPGRDRQGARRSRSSYAQGHRRARAPASSRRPSPRRPRPTSSASRPCSAAASARSSRPASRRWSKAGYQPEIAYFECLHELKLIVDLMYRGGLNYMRYSVSDTAEHGDYTGGARIVTDADPRGDAARCSRKIQDGTYAKSWIAENEAGRPWFNATRAAEQTQQLEEVGAKLRAMMPFLDPVTVRPDGQGV